MTVMWTVTHAWAFTDTREQDGSGWIPGLLKGDLLLNRDDNCIKYRVFNMVIECVETGEVDRAWGGEL